MIRRWFSNQEGQIKVEEIKNEENTNQETPKGTSMFGWYILATAGIVGSVFYHLNESDRIERLIDGTIRSLESLNADIQKIGVDSIEECLSLQKCLMTGITEIPISKNFLIEKGIIQALTHVIENTEDAYVREKAFIWLNRFSDDEDGKKQIAKFAIKPILQQFGESEIESPIWFEAASILLKLGSHPDITPEWRRKIQEITQNILQSHHPIAILVASHLLSLFNKETLSSEVKDIIESTPSRAALLAAFQTAIPIDPTLLRPPFELRMLNNLNWAIVFGYYYYYYFKSRIVMN